MSTIAARRSGAAGGPGPDEPERYVLDEQVGYLLRQVQQRHAVIFAEGFLDELTPLQWAATARLAEVGECSQNRLGRLVATDVATIKGVVERLTRRGLVETRPDPEDKRRVLLRLGPQGLAVYRSRVGEALAVSDRTLSPLGQEERAVLLGLLDRLR